MPANCTFVLNNKPLSTLMCDGQGYAAFSGEVGHKNNPADVAKAGEGPLPTGTYYIIDRQSGGHLGWLYDWLKNRYTNSERENWFALYRNDGKIDDTTYVNGVKRGNFRLHPVGRQGISEGCVTLVSPPAFNKLRAYLKSQSPTTIPGTNVTYYGTLTVR